MYKQLRIFLLLLPLLGIAGPAAGQGVNFSRDMAPAEGWIHIEKGWNHFLIKVVSDSYWWPGEGTLAVRMESTKKAFISD